MRTVPLGELWTWSTVDPDFCDRCSQALAGRAAVETSTRQTICPSCVVDLELAPVDSRRPFPAAAAPNLY